MTVERKSESKALDRTQVELSLDAKSGMLSRKDAIAAVAQELGVAPERVALIRLYGASGTTKVKGKFYVYGSPESKKKLHPSYLDERALTKEEREKLKQERKKAKAPAPAAEAK